MCKADTFSGSFRKEPMQKWRIVKAACYCKSLSLSMHESVQVLFEENVLYTDKT